MATVASKVPFYQLCVILEKIQKKQGNVNKKAILRDFIDEWRKFHSKLHQNDNDSTDSFYPAMRLLLPHLERERDAYGIKEVMLAKLYIDILGLGKTSPSAQKLLNFRAPKNAKSDAGDFAMVAFTVLQTRCPEKGTLTIAQVNDCLDKIAVANANKDRAGVKKSLEHMLRTMSAKEQKWLIRMIMKELKMGLSQQSIFSVFHDDAEDLFNVKMSLQKVCETLKDPSVRLHEVEISLFSPFRPMLGDRGQPQKVEKLMDGKEYIIETKFDGERMQIHKKDNEFKYYSRSGNEYTHVFGGDEWNGTFTPHISNCFKPHVTSCILDGEMVGFDPVRETIGTKGQQFDIKSMDTREYQPMLCVFDVLMVNDEVLSNKTLRERKKALENVFNAIPGRIVLSECSYGKTREDCIEALNSAIDRREEGIMVKDPESVYKPNVRKGGWFKMKPDYLSGVMDELDVIVVGGFFGAGHRSNLLSHFLCAVAVPPATSGDEPTKFKTFCKVGSGYTRTELYDFNQKLKNHWQKCSKRGPPDWLEFATGYKQRPELIIEPKNSCILQIRAAEITPSEQFATDCTLRFPRVEKIRDDKLWSDCMTTTELEELRQKASGKLATRLVDFDGDDDDAHPKAKRRKMTSSALRHVKPTVMSRFVGVDSADVTKVSEMLSGKEICVINTPSGSTKADMEKRIIEYGGTIAQNPGLDTFCVLADKVTVKINNLIKKGRYDVVKAAWLLRCIEAKRLLPWVPADMIHATPQTTQMFAAEFDPHGDSYYDDTNVEALRKVFASIEKDEEQYEKITSEEIAEMEMQYFPHDSPYGLFRTCRFFLDDCLALDDIATRIPNCDLELPALELRYHGATMRNTLDDVTHVLVSSRDTSRLKTLKEQNRKRARKFHIVSESWVTDCLAKQKLLTERHYEPDMIQVSK